MRWSTVRIACRLWGAILSFACPVAALRWVGVVGRHAAEAMECVRCIRGEEDAQCLRA